ncbi:hypothetical protein Moror_652 [Moniliophthora roreri MCA 2997]|uniref:Uncharacterized protein n=2 Tax=Moniliophthora roreri TaxID=221103 RepID=V2WWY5_MONRO|nr:hypothetical protein Moror_652 [Moniliophthora roreri MCA 2997]KAI3608743.1 hypothetical protein WG66_003747 [Moniliophthora roreri]
MPPPKISDLSDIHEAHCEDPLSFYNENIMKNIIFKRSGPGWIAAAKDSQADEAATLKIVGQLPLNKDFFCATDGAYRSYSTEPFSSAEQRISLDQPTHCIPFNEKFRDAMKRVNNVMLRECTPGFTRIGAFIPPNEESKFGRLKLKHSIFQLKDLNATGESEAELDPVFTWKGWPTNSDAAAKALDDLRKEGTHDLVPMPAFDIEDNLIFPTKYRSSLQNTVVEAHFTLEHWKFTREKRDVFRATIVKVNVLTPPFEYTIPSPRRRVMMKDRDSPNSKRRKLAASSDNPVLVQAPLRFGVNKD